MRLIDADKLIEELTIKAVSKDAHIISIANAVVNFVNNQPTAYSVERVVEELKERTDFLKDCTKYGNKNAKQQSESYSTMMMYEVADLVDDLIEIVKQDCVSDDVCEWHKAKNDNAYKCNTHAEIHDSRVLDWCKCPYCGKKIKVVE